MGSAGLGTGDELVSPRSLGVDVVLLPGGGDADVTHRVGCVRAASLPGTGGTCSGSLARKMPIAAAVLLALSDGSWRCQLEGPDFAPSCRAREPAGCAGGKRCQLGCRQHTLSPRTCRPRAGQSRRSTCLFGLHYLGCALGARCCPAAPCQRRQGCMSLLLPAGLAAHPCCWQGSRHTACIPSPRRSLLLSPSPGSGSSAQQPSHSAAWPCLWSSRRGTKDGSGAALRHRTCTGTCLSPAKGLPRGSADPFPQTRSCRNTDAFSAGGAGSPS